jgi:hypothetical protein
VIETVRKYVSDFGRGQSYVRLKLKTDGKEYSKEKYTKKQTNIKPNKFKYKCN